MVNGGVLVISKATRAAVFLTVSLAIASCNSDQKSPLRGADDAMPNQPAAAAGAPASATQASAPAATAGREERLSAGSVVLEDPAFMALSTEELGWLRASGFLTQEELAELAFASEDELLAKSRVSSDARSATLLGMKRMANGDMEGAARALDKAAREGSIYALEQLAYAELSSRTGWKPGSATAISPSDQVLFVARMEQARLLGDHRVDYYINRVAPGLDRRMYGSQILAQTQEYMRQLAEDAALRRRRLTLTTRPGIDAWESLGGSRAPTPVVVYRPGG
jgi:hypothetical protein